MRKLLAVVTACTVLCACGGGTSPSPALPSTGNPTVQSQANAVATITIPSKLTSSHRKRPMWISPNTLSIDFASVVNGNQVAYSAAALTPASPNCTGSGGGLTCTVPFAVVPGPQSMTVTVYDATQPANGSPLATTTQQITGVGGITNNYSFNLSGIPAVVYTTSAVSSYQSGTGGSFSVPVSAEDADGNAIPGPFDQIINTVPEDTTHSISVNPATLNSGSATLNVNIAPNPSVATTILNYCSPIYQPFCGSSVHGPIQIQMQLPSNSIYVANTGGSNILAFMAGTGGNAPFVRNIPSSTKQYFNVVPAGGGGAPVAVAVDGGGAARYSETSSNAVLWTAPGVGNTSPRTLSQSINAIVGSATTFNSPAGLTIDGSGLDWIANSASNSLVVMNCCGGNRAPLRTVSGALTGLNNPTAIAFEGSTNSIFVVSNGNAILKFPSSASGNVAPAATITSASFGAAGGIAVTGGKIYVTDTANGSISIFPNTANGASTPATIIQGAATGLSQPRGIAVDGTGNIYVANTAANSITVYAGGASGNAAPIRTISGPNTGLNAPNGISLRP